jgi:hypothetical protein
MTTGLVLDHHGLCTMCESPYIMISFLTFDVCSPAQGALSATSWTLAGLLVAAFMQCLQYNSCRLCDMPHARTFP